MKLKDQIAVVTGGSRGIGYAVVRAFLKEGAEVVLCASRSETAERAVSQLKAELPEARVWGIWPSLEDPEQVRTAFDRIGAEHGRIDILVNNAGVSESTPFGAYTGELFDRVMDLNVKGMFHCARGAVPWMERQGRGVILNTSSMVSFYGQPAGVAYPVSKFAVNGFTLSLARELAPKGIRVNAVAPGIIETDMLRAVPREVLDRAPDTDHMLDDMIHWPDNPEDAWYYEDVQEATNCHTYRWSGSLERWIQITDMRTYADLVRDALRSAR